MMTIETRLRCLCVPQGACSISTHHVALLIVPEETTYRADIDCARVYGIDSAVERDEVLDLPDCWTPAGEITGEEYRRLSEADHDVDLD